jgi:hypothetical protein
MINATPSSPDPRSAVAFAKFVLAAAAETEAAETEIKQAILDAATAGDCARVIDIVTRWQRLPASEVLGDGLE